MGWFKKELPKIDEGAINYVMRIMEEAYAFAKEYSFLEPGVLTLDTQSKHSGAHGTVIKLFMTLSYTVPLKTVLQCYDTVCPTISWCQCGENVLAYEFDLPWTLPSKHFVSVMLQEAQNKHADWIVDISNSAVRFSF